MRAVAGELSAQLSWNAPQSDGGAAITDYIIEYSTNNGATWTTLNDGVSIVRVVEISSLTSDATYVFRVTPVNIAGRGATSIASNAVQPTSPPQPVVESPIKPVLIPVVENPPAVPDRTRRPRVPVVTPVVIDRLPGSGGVEVEPGEAAALVSGVPRDVNLVVEDSGTAVVESVGEFVIRVTPQHDLGGIVAPNQGGQLQAISGRTIRFSGQGFAPNSVIEAWINSSPILLGEVTTDATGSFTAEFELPAGVEVGAHTLSLKGVSVEGTEVVTSMGLNVIDEIEDNTPEVDGGDTQDSQDPDNGAPIAPLGAGLLLLLALAGFWAVRRKRNS